ncbi:MAG: oligosaccharide flippase family protein [Candidatus Fimenecus sp.]
MNRKIGVIYSYGLMVVEIFSTMLFTPYLIRTLGQAEYGVYQLVSSVTSYLVLLDLGVGSSVIRYMSKYRAEKDMLAQRRFLGISTIYYLLIAVVALIIGISILFLFPNVFAKGLSTEEIALAKKLFAVTMCSAAFSLATSGFANALIAYERFNVSKGVSIILTVVKIVAGTMALWLGFSSFGVVCVNFMVTVVTRTIYVLYVLCKLKIRPVFHNIEFSFVKEVAAYSSFILLQLIASHINAMSDQILLASFAKNASVIIGIYGVGAQILQYFKTIGSHFTSVLMPGLVRLVENGVDRRKYEQEMIRISRLVFMALALVFTVFAVFGQDFICLWAGEENAQAYFVAVVLMFPTLFSYSEGVGYQLLQAMAKHKLPAVVQVVSAVLNIGLTILLIRWEPLKGAVIGSFIALFFCETVVMNIMYKRQIHIRLTVYFRGMFKGILPCLLLSAGAGVLLKTAQLSRFGWLGFVVNCGVMVAVYAGTMFLFGMNAYEKNLVLKPMQKICKGKFNKG